MLKIPVNRLFIAFFICVSLYGLALADDLIITGSGNKDILVDENSFEFKVDFSNANVDGLKKLSYDKSYRVVIGGCDIRFWGNVPCPGGADHSGHKFGNNHMGIDKKDDKPGPSFFHDKAVSATVIKEVGEDVYGSTTNSKIRARAQSIVGNGDTMWCNVQRQASQYPGKVLVKVEIRSEGEPVDPKLVTTFYNVYDPTATTSTTPKPATTILEPTKVSTTQASSNSLSISTPVDISTTLKPPCPQCEERGLESWLIALIVATIFLALLAIGLCVVVLCCYRRMQKSKTQKVVKNEHTTVGSTMGTVSTAPGTLVKETNLYGPEMMYFGRGATPLDPNAKSEATNLATQINPALSTNPMQATK